MKKFVLSLVTFILGVLGVLFCLINGTKVEYIITAVGTDSSSRENYYYALSSPAINGLLLFGLIAIFGLVLSIKYSKEIDK